MKPLTILMTLTVGLGACGEDRPPPWTPPSEAAAELIPALAAIEAGRWEDARGELDRLVAAHPERVTARWLAEEVRGELVVREALTEATALLEHGEKGAAWAALDVAAGAAATSLERDDYLDLRERIGGATLALTGSGVVWVPEAEDADLRALPARVTTLAPGWRELVYAPSAAAPKRRFAVWLTPGRTTTVALDDVAALDANAVRLDGTDYLLGGEVRTARGAGVDLWFPELPEWLTDKFDVPLFGPRVDTSGQPVAVERVKLHRDPATDARRGFDALARAGRSAHFLVGPDGLTLQVLDTNATAVFDDGVDASAIGVVLYGEGAGQRDSVARLASALVGAFPGIALEPLCRDLRGLSVPAEVCRSQDPPAAEEVRR